MEKCPMHAPAFEVSGDDLLSLEAMDDPFPVYRQMRETAPVVAMTRNGVTYYHVNGWEASIAALRDNRFSKDSARMAQVVTGSGQTGSQAGFVLSGAAKGHLLNTDPPEHTRLRNLVALAFSPRQIAAQEEAIKALANERLAAFAGRSEADIVSDYAYPIAITMICRILGVPASDQDKFRVWATAASTPYVIPDATVSQAEGAQALQQYLSDLITDIRRRAAAGEASEDIDVLSAMASAQIERDALSDEELRSMAFLLLIAGHETTVGLISAALLRLARHPGQRAKLVADPTLMQGAVEEFLRFDGSVQRTTFRVATEDIEIAGYVIPKGSATVIALPTANRDPARFEDPETFDVTRKLVPNLAFGNGPHFCLGNALARSETRIAVGAFIQRYPSYEAGAPTWARTVIRAPSSLPVRLGEAAQR